jgi:hypothetical protein
MSVQRLRLPPHDDPFTPPPPALGGALDRADAAIAAELKAAEDEAARRAEAERREAQDRADADARDANDDRLADSINIVRATEAQIGRHITSRKGAATVTLIKRLLDALHADDAPATNPQFEPGAKGGRSALDMAAIERAIAGAAEAEAPHSAPEGGAAAAPQTDEPTTPGAAS